MEFKSDSYDSCNDKKGAIIMTSKSHYYLGLYLSDMIFEDLNDMERAAFLYGCVEPDLNPGTYLKGTLCGQQKFRGHNYPNMLPCVEHLFDRLQNTKHVGIRYYYRMGKLAHYMTDAFTYPHNQTFHGTLKEHVQYEAAMEPVFLQTLQERRDTEVTAGEWDGYDFFRKSHERYLMESRGVHGDITGTLRVVPHVLAVIHYEAMCHVTFGGDQEVRYENIAHI